MERAWGGLVPRNQLTVHMIHRLHTRALLFSALAAAAFADGSEALGTPSIDLPAQGEVVLGGVGLLDAQPASFTFAVPAGRSVQKVLGYWEGLDSPGSTQGETDAILVNGLEVIGDRIGGATNFFKQYYTSGYRADLTSLGLLATGSNTLTVEGLDYTYSNNGFALVVLLDGDEELRFADGLDYAYTGFDDPYDTTEPVVYTFDAADEARAASVSLVLSGVAPERPSVIEVRVDGLLTIEEIDLLNSNLGAEIDAHTLDLTVPAGATEVSVRVLSEDRGGAFSGNQEASLTWLYASLALEAASDEAFGCDPYWWKCNWWRWDPWCTDDNLTQTIDLKDKFNDTFDVTPWESGLWYCSSLWSGLNGWGSWWNWSRRLLNREAVAALANADADIGYPYSKAEVIAIYRDAIGAAPGDETICSAFWKFYDANRLGCPF